VGDCGVILVVDRDREFRVRAEEVFARANLSVRAAADAEACLELLVGERPSLAIVEVELPQLNGLALLAQLLETFGPDFPVILTSAERGAPLDRAAGLLLGANDYLVKPVDPAELVARVRRSLRRVSAPVKAYDAVARTDSTLSPRERQILGFLAQGQTQTQIATALVISPKTVGTHIQHVLSKLGVHSRAQAVVEAFRLGVVTSQTLPDLNS
jgi:DNA-binding NarL/FixJ family response regulator